MYGSELSEDEPSASLANTPAAHTVSHDGTAWRVNPGSYSGPRLAAKLPRDTLEEKCGGFVQALAQSDGRAACQG